MSIILRRQYDTRLATVLIFAIFCPQGVSWGSNNSLRLSRDATPSRHSPTFPQIKPAKINLSLFGRFQGGKDLHFSVRQRIMPNTRQYAYCSFCRLRRPIWPWNSNAGCRSPWRSARKCRFLPSLPPKSRHLTPRSPKSLPARTHVRCSSSARALPTARIRCSSI